MQVDLLPQALSLTFMLSQSSPARMTENVDDKRRFMKSVAIRANLLTMCQSKFKQRAETLSLGKL